MVAVPAFAAVADGELFEEASGFKSRSQEPWVLRSRAVLVNFGWLDGVVGAAEKSGAGTVFIDLDLFHDVLLAVVFDHIERSDRDALILGGQVVGYPDSRIVLVSRGGVLVGSLRTADSLFRVRYSGEGAHVIDELAEDSLPPETLPIEVGASFSKPKGGGDNGSISTCWWFIRRRRGLGPAARQPWRT